MNRTTHILQTADQRDPKAATKLLPLVYAELRKLAECRMAQERPGQTLQATALVHEAWLRLVGKEEGKEWQNRAHFFAAAAEAMRRILIDRARQKNALKRGSGAVRVNLDDVNVAAAVDEETLLILDEALKELAATDPASAEFIKLRFFTGLTNTEAAQALGIPERTARRHWSFARAWLYRAICRRAGGELV